MFFDIERKKSLYLQNEGQKMKSEGRNVNVNVTEEKFKVKKMTRKVIHLSYWSLMNCTISSRKKNVFGYKSFKEMFGE